MPVHEYFVTMVYTAPLQRTGVAALNRQLLQESRQLRLDDDAGRRWSSRNYADGYTSYGSSHHLQRISPTFETLEKRLRPHVRKFAHAAQWDLAARRLTMTDCWVNIMGRNAAHGQHLHPLSTLSGIYYVQVPRGSPGLKFEDPRLDRFMAAPPRRSDADSKNKAWITLPAMTGHVILFESWLRHEVVRHGVAGERVSVSFNYNWF
ncbi:MAG: TIGR02466 family protein [Steroidobacteraceae bacterium]